MSEDEELEIHHIQLLHKGHWPGRSCYCRPAEVEINAPCGHLVVVLVHEPMTDELREKIKADVMGYYKPHPKGHDDE